MNLDEEVLSSGSENIFLNKVISNKISTFIASSNIISKDDISSNNINSYNLITQLFEINSSSYIDSLIEIICPKEKPFKQINKNECVKNCEINDIIEKQCILDIVNKENKIHEEEIT